MSGILDPTSSRSFTPLATLSLSSPHHLHPGSCNPAMDLVVLLAPVGQSSQPAFQADKKGKGRALDMSSWKGTRIALWRMLGSKVWEVDMKGWVGGLAWSRDGLSLSILAINTSIRSICIEHRSVHTGEVIKVVPLDLPQDIWNTDMFAEDFGLEWTESGLEWESPKDGSARMIIGSLPIVTPVEPPKPAVINPFAKPPPASTSKLPHPKLQSFPTLLTSPTTPSDILYITHRNRRTPLLTGSFAFSGKLRPSHLRLAQSADLLGSFLNTTSRGIEAIEAAWREGSKQTMIWREELEECGKLQGMSIQDVHADLFRFLMTGRSREAISEWMGNKLTGRTLAKWEETLISNLEKIHKVLCESIIPALERVVIVLEELRGWQRSEYHSNGLNLQPQSIERSLKVSCGLLKLFERIRLDAEHECSAAKAWFAWLKYETAKAGSGGGDEPHVATHDLKLTWSFLTNGFVRSIFSTYFPDTPSRPPTETLPMTLIQQLYRKPPSRDLDKILSETLSVLSGHPPRLGPVSPSLDMSPDKSSMIMSSPIPSRENEQSGIEMSLEMDDSKLIDSDDESVSGTAGRSEDVKNEENVDGRSLEMEPWVWANTLVESVQGLIKVAVESTDDEEYIARVSDGMDTSWVESKQDWGGLNQRGRDF